MTYGASRRTPFLKVLIRKIVQLWFLGAPCFMFYNPTRIQQLKLSNINHDQEQEHDFGTTGKASQFPEDWKKGMKDPFLNLTIAGDENSPGLI